MKPGEAVTCTFTTTHDDIPNPPGTLVVAQETVRTGDAQKRARAGDATLFTYTGDVAGQISDGQRIVQGGLKAGTYTSQQLVPQGWVLAAIDCDDGESTGDLETATATFRLQPAETVTCTFTDAQRYDWYVPLVFYQGR